MSARSSESVAASAVRPEFKSSIEVATRTSAAADTIIDTGRSGKFPGERDVIAARRSSATRAARGAYFGPGSVLGWKALDVIDHQHLKRFLTRLQPQSQRLPDRLAQSARKMSGKRRP